jgi:hypothetical protein
MKKRNGKTNGILRLAMNRKTSNVLTESGRKTGPLEIRLTHHGGLKVSDGK